MFSDGEAPTAPSRTNFPETGVLFRSWRRPSCQTAISGLSFTAELMATELGTVSYLSLDPTTHHGYDDGPPDAPLWPVALPAAAGGVHLAELQLPCTAVLGPDELLRSSAGPGA